MKIDSLKTNLRNIVLLAKEYKEEIPKHVQEEIKSIQTALKDKHEINEYDRQFFNATQEHRRKIFEQIIYFIEEVFMELAKRDPGGKSLWGRNHEYILDVNKFNSAMKALTKEESRLLESASNLILHPEKFKLGDFESVMGHLLECANSISSSGTPDNQRPRKVQKSA